MLDGRQWLVFEGDRSTGGQWRELKVSRSNEYIPRPVTNYLFDSYQTLKAYLLQHRPRSTVRPNKQDFQNKQAAKLAELILETNWERLKEEYNYEYAAAVVLAYGTVFKKTYWDTSTVSTVKVPKTVMAPQFDPMTGQVIGQMEVEAKDPQTGDVLYDELPLGDVNTCVVEPYRLALDPLASDLHTPRWIMEYSIQPLSWIRETYNQDGEGYTGLAEEVKEEKNLSSSMLRYYQLKTSSGVKYGGQLAPGGSRGTSSEEMIENAAVVKEYYEKPTRQYPKGRLIVVANNKTLYSGDSPYSGTEMGDWHPYSECRWEILPGRFWGKSPLDDATEIQKHLNSIDATVILTRKTTAIPQKLIPTNSGVKPGEWTGRPGQEIHYRPGEGKPETIIPVGVDSQVFTERAQKLEDLKQITGAIDILKGDRPAGVNAASALEMLYEVGTGKLKPALDRWKRFIESDQKKQLKVTTKFYKEPRPEYIKMLHAKNKDIPEETINHFIGTDLYDNCNVIIEAGSNVPKLQSAEKAQLLQLAQTGALQLENPENRIEFLDRMGVVGFDTDVGPDVTRAEWENDLIDNISYSPDNKPIVFNCDDHIVHKTVHERRMKEPSFMSLPPDVQQAYMAHIQEHDMYMEQEQQMQMMQAAQGAMVGLPPPEPEAPANAPTPIKSAGKGLPADTQESMAKAGGIPGKGGTVG